MKNLRHILLMFAIVISVSMILQSCTKPADENQQTYMSDSTLTVEQKRELAIEDHLKVNNVLFKMKYKNNDVPSIVDDFTSLDVIEMNYDSMTYLIVRSKYNNSDFIIINPTLDKAMIEYYKSSIHKSNVYETRTKEENKSLYGTDITRGYFDKN